MKIIGVDLGTTNSCVYYLDESGQPVLVMPEGRWKFFPSAVWCGKSGGDPVVGHAAKSKLGQSPPPIVAVKRKMGTTETVVLGGRSVTAVEVSTHILTYARRLVEKATGDQVGGVVVTVPAYFDAAPKNDTYRAAVDAFFDGDEAMAKGRIQLQLEPEAAAFAYAIEDPAESLRVLVYDLGGGTFDVTILEKSRDVGLAVIKFGGDPHLGGDNFDDRVAAWTLYLLRGGKPEALERILAPGRYAEGKRYTILQQLLTHDEAALATALRPEDADLLIGSDPPFHLDLDRQDPEDHRRIQTLKRLAEQAKIDLTATAVATIARQGAFEDKRGQTVDIDLSLSRIELERLVGDLVGRTVECTHQVMRASGLTPSDIQRVLLVGGSSRMPVVREALQTIFDAPILLVDPDLIVARGAAFRARALSPPPLGVSAEDVDLTIDSPRETADGTILILGRLRQPLAGHAFLLRGQAELDQVVVGGDRFVFRDVPLERNALNRFRVDVTDEHENPVVSAEVLVRHGDDVVGGDRLAPKITKPIRALAVNGYYTLFPEGEVLPATRPFVCYRATRDEHIDIEFYQGEQPLATLRLSAVGAGVPIGAPIDLQIAVTETYAVSATATIRETGQSQSVEFEITPLTIPPLAQMDQDLEATLAQIENDLRRVDDANRRTELGMRVARLTAEYRKARRELSLDYHKLYVTIGELRTVLVEIRAAQVLLHPPLEEIAGLCGVCRGLAGRVPAGGPVRAADVEEKVAALERAARGAWERQAAVEYRQVYEELTKLHGELERVLHGPTEHRPPPPAPVLQRGLLEWLAEIQGKVTKHALEPQFGRELEGLVRATRGVDLRREDVARDTLLTILREQVNPLDYSVDEAIKAKGGVPAPTQATVRF